MTKWAQLLTKTLIKFRWINLSAFCNGKTHPCSFPYRPYRRGSNRCHECGAKLGKVQCERKSYSQLIVDNVQTSNPILSRLSKKRIYTRNEGHGQFLGQNFNRIGTSCVVLAF